MGRKGKKRKKQNLADDAIRLYNHQQAKKPVAPKREDGRGTAASASPKIFPGWLSVLTNRQAVAIIVSVGLAIFGASLGNQFLGDDSQQIVNNPVVHSVSHVPVLFRGSTFYAGGGIAPLFGVYYRPLMMTAFSVLYTVFGAHAFFFHLFQLAVCVASAVVLYLFLRFSLSVWLSLALALVFLVHPLNSEIAFAISTLQDALFFFFGISALYVLARYDSVRSLVAVAGLLLLSLLSKETGVYFCAMCVLFALWYSPSRLKKFLPLAGAALLVYLVLKTQAVGLLGHNPNNAPIDRLTLGERLVNAPATLIFFVERLLFPIKLGAGYYGVYTKIGFTDFVLPLIACLSIAVGLVFTGKVLRERTDKATFYKYIFFCVWAAMGLLTALQIIPLDMSVSESWFYFSVAGTLGVVGIVVRVFFTGSKLLAQRTAWVFCVLLVLFGGRTFVRGFDWRNMNTLARHDIHTTSDDYQLLRVAAVNYNNVGDYANAIKYANKSNAVWPTTDAYSTLCTAQYASGDGPAAARSCMKAASFPLNVSEQTYTNAAALALRYSTPSGTLSVANTGLTHYATNSDLWLYKAIAQYEQNQTAQAKESISKSVHYGQNTRNQAAYNAIMSGKPLFASAN